MSSSLLLEQVPMVNQWLPVWSWSSMSQYNCSRVLPVGDEWTTTKGFSRPYFGYWSIFWGITCEIVYLPCALALYMERKQSCYRIMLWLAIVDVVALFSAHVLGSHGWLDASDSVVVIDWDKCHGVPTVGMWCGACIGCLLLVTYRLFELMNMSFRFEAKANILIALATCYALYFAFFTPPVLTNSELNAMFYDPFIGDIPSEVYVNWPHTVNNLLIVMTSALLYILLCAVLITQYGAMSSEEGRKRISTNGPIFIQASLICIFNVAASLETLLGRNKKIRQSSNKNTVTSPIQWSLSSPRKF
ncbi:hypothetical protein PRIPAC_78550 [Pristionchus pacificus]|uniref:G protein-coupled receptor n=1 Tax=Pristionchus pacificus TaxID=54126 RepID=A0A2A6C3D9_PRIPA|nr:hypothetical protein PRIPAC_78550 [Pristionchus pacificus]|eukprot:PDM72543.1 G protein-coupled receptor [Pristionchus pacificus]